jgi:uncharacterized protein (DUF2147 family)
MKPLILIAALGTALLAAPLHALAQSSPAGLWKTIDDDGKTEKSLVRVTEQAGVFSGRIEQLLAPDAKRDAVCDACSDERRNQPLIGLTILHQVRHSGDDAGLWEGGDILDPKNGKTYKVRLRPVDNGRRLEVRGYIGMPLLGRTQTWIRVE